MLAASTVQVFQSDALHNDARNSRTAYESYEFKRGQIG